MGPDIDSKQWDPHSEDPCTHTLVLRILKPRRLRLLIVVAACGAASSLHLNLAKIRTSKQVSTRTLVQF